MALIPRNAFEEAVCAPQRQSERVILLNRLAKRKRFPVIINQSENRKRKRAANMLCKQYRQ